MNSPQYDSDSALRQGVTLFENSLFDEAKKVCIDILKHHPDHPDATQMLGAICYETKNFDLAIRLMKHSIALHSKPPAHYFLNLAIVMDFQEKYTAAIPLFQRAIELGPKSVLAHNLFGQALQKNGDQAEALRCYRRALELAPDNAEPYYFLGTLLDEQGKTVDAVNCYRAALIRRVSSAKTCSLLGNAFNRHGCHTEALACYRHVLTFYKHDKKTSPLRLGSNAWLRLIGGKLRGKVLSVGSGNDFDKENSLYREYFSNCDSYTRLDMESRVFPDIVGDIQNLTDIIADGVYNVVFSLCALEHVQNVEAAVAEIHRILAPDGFFIFGLPLNLGYHSFPCDFHRFTRAGIEALLAKKFHLAQIRPVGPMEQFTLDPRLRLYGETPDTAPHGHVGIALKI